MMDNLGPENCRKFSDQLEDMGLRQEFVLKAQVGVGKSARLGKVWWDVVSSGSITMEPQMIDMTMLMEAS